MQQQASALAAPQTFPERSFLTRVPAQQHRRQRSRGRRGLAVAPQCIVLIHSCHVHGIAAQCITATAGRCSAATPAWPAAAACAGNARCCRRVIATLLGLLMPQLLNMPLRGSGAGAKHATARHMFARGVPLSSCSAAETGRAAGSGAGSSIRSGCWYAAGGFAKAAQRTRR